MKPGTLVEVTLPTGPMGNEVKKTGSFNFHCTDERTLPGTVTPLPDKTFRHVYGTPFGMLVRVYPTLPGWIGTDGEQIPVALLLAGEGYVLIAYSLLREVPT